MTFRPITSRIWVPIYDFPSMRVFTVFSFINIFWSPEFPSGWLLRELEDSLVHICSSSKLQRPKNHTVKAGEPPHSSVASFPLFFLLHLREKSIWQEQLMKEDRWALAHDF